MTDLIGRTLNRLGQQLRGRLSMPGDDGYAAATAIWAKPIGRVPRAVVHCRTSEDVRLAIRAARDCDLPLSVRGGGHDWAGRALCNGIVVDLSVMRGVAIDPQWHTARVSGGATASDVAAMADPLHLAAVAGSVGSVGMAGFTLGGGYGPLNGRFGLALDNLVAAEVVLADGRVVVAGPDNEEELFWALRGGGGNFGVVTGFEFRLHELGSLVYLGMFFWGLEQGAEALRLGRDVAAALPRNAGLLLAAGLTAPAAPFVPAQHHGISGYALLIAGFGSAGEHATLIEEIRQGLPPLFEFVRPLPYLELQRFLDGTAPWGIHAYEKSLYLRHLSDEAITALTEHIPRKHSSMSFIPILTMGGAFADIGEQETAFGGSRATRFVVNVTALAPDAELLAADRSWARSVWQTLVPYAIDAGGYINFMADHDADRVRMAYGPTKYQRLAVLKGRYDPDNVFWMNANIKPASQPKS
jgi:FAD/FMN-containing dehydrogenase